VDDDITFDEVMNYYDSKDVARVRKWLAELREAIDDPLDETVDASFESTAPSDKEWHSQLRLLADDCELLAKSIRAWLPKLPN
jgi:hypothetical protein